MKMSWVDCCLKRKSIRFYNGKPISMETVNLIQEFTEKVIEEDHSWRKHTNIRVVYTKHDFNSDNVTNCKDFLAIIASKNASRDELMECGYIFQKIILFCTSISVDTVWIGGRWLTDKFDDYYYVNKNESNNFDSDNETVVCVTPIGYRGTPGWLARRLPFCGNGSSSRFCPEKMFFEDEVGKAMDIKSLPKDHQLLLECFRYSPSSCNLQKWKILKHKDNYHFFTYPSSSFYTNIDIGIGLCNWLVAAEDLKIEGKFVQLDRRVMKENGILEQMFGKNNSKFSPSGFFSSTNWFGFENCIKSLVIPLYEKTRFHMAVDGKRCVYFMSWITANEDEELFEYKKDI